MVAGVLGLRTEQESSRRTNIAADNFVRAEEGSRDWCVDLCRRGLSAGSAPVSAFSAGDYLGGRSSGRRRPWHAP